jgi:hypothetical protein
MANAVRYRRLDHPITRSLFAEQVGVVRHRLHMNTVPSPVKKGLADRVDLWMLCPDINVTALLHMAQRSIQHEIFKILRV